MYNIVPTPHMISFTPLPLTLDKWHPDCSLFSPLAYILREQLSKYLMKLAVSSSVYIHLLIYLSWKHIQQTDYFTPTISPPHIFSLHLLPHYPFSYFPFAVCYVSYLSSISISPFIMQSHHHIFPLIYWFVITPQILHGHISHSSLFLVPLLSLTSLTSSSSHHPYRISPFLTYPLFSSLPSPLLVSSLHYLSHIVRISYVLYYLSTHACPPIFSGPSLVFSSSVVAGLFVLTLFLPYPFYSSLFRFPFGGPIGPFSLYLFFGFFVCG